MSGARSAALQRLRPIARLPHELQSVAGQGEAGEPAKARVVVDQQQPQHHRLSLGRPSGPS